MFDFLERIRRKEIVLPGKIVLLRTLGSRDFKKLKEWFKDPEVMQYGFGTKTDGVSLQVMVREYEKEIIRHRQNLLGIEVTGVGLIGFLNYFVNTLHAKGKVGILIGEKEMWGRGYGTDAMTTLLGYLFSELGLSRVELDTAYFNSRALRCFEKCGFKRDQRLTEKDAWDGKNSPKVWMSVTRAEFLNGHKTGTSDS
ncbi:MAG: GNAT family N-acetyltransferase [Armatimonadetes bacterium]|nr:GNAT family N-acetyltransferase [Armatimonadota bacterium]